MTRNEVYEEFLKDVLAKGDAIDPSNDRDWYDMAVGYAIAKGFSPPKAKSFAQWAIFSQLGANRYTSLRRS